MKHDINLYASLTELNLPQKYLRYLGDMNLYYVFEVAESDYARLRKSLGRRITNVLIESLKTHQIEIGQGPTGIDRKTCESLQFIRAISGLKKPWLQVVKEFSNYLIPTLDSKDSQNTTNFTTLFDGISDSQLLAMYTFGRN